MNKILILIASVAFLSGCYRNPAGDDNQPDTSEIVLGAGTSVVAISRGAIVDDGLFSAGVAGWESNAGSATYTNAATWETATDDIKASAIAQSVTLKAKQVYSPDNAVKSYMKAWYPVGVLASGKVTFTNTDGTVDAMLSQEVVGSKDDKSNKILIFKHKTTQLRFVAKAGSGLGANTKLTSIKVRGAELPIGFNLTTNVAEYASAATVGITGIDGNLVIGTTAVGDAAGLPIMIKPMIGNKVYLDIVTSAATFSNIAATIDNDLNFVEGKAYTITLTFSNKGVELSAIVDDWTEGTGTGNVE